MKARQTIFDATGYAKAVQGEFENMWYGNGLVMSPMGSGFPIGYGMLSPGSSIDLEEQVMKKAKEKVDRSQFETNTEYGYLGAVTVDNKPCLLVYDEAGAIKTISIAGCKIINESNGEEAVK